MLHIVFLPLFFTLFYTEWLLSSLLFKNYFSEVISVEFELSYRVTLVWRRFIFLGSLVCYLQILFLFTEKSLFHLHFKILLLCVHNILWWLHAMVCIWRSEDIFSELVLCPYFWGFWGSNSGGQYWSTRCFYLMSHLTVLNALKLYLFYLFGGHGCMSWCTCEGQIFLQCGLSSRPLSSEPSCWPSSPLFNDNFPSS